MMKKTILFLVASVLSLVIPIIGLFFWVKDELDVPAYTVFIFLVVWITLLYAIAGGFEWSQGRLAGWRDTLFVLLGGFGPAVVFGLFWFGLRILLGLVFKVPELAHSKLLRSAK